MVPNPIYMGNPIYEEIFDLSYKQHSLKKINGVPCSEDHASKSAEVVKGIDGSPLPDESKSISEKYANLPVS